MNVSDRRQRCWMIKPIIVFGCLIFLAGCISNIKGEYFLSAGEYDKGISIFKEELKKKPGTADNHYYLGRLFLAKGDFKTANAYLTEAVRIDPTNASYHFWTGLSYGGLKSYQKEMASYLKAIEISPDHTLALTYLGHNYFRKKAYAKALASYDRALTVRSNNPSALYNRALVLSRLGNTQMARSGFKAYIQKYPDSPKTLRAAEYLNRMGDFEYRPHQIHKRKVVLKKIEFTPEEQELEKDSLSELKRIGRMIKNSPGRVLHIIVYEKNRLQTARQKALAIQTYLQDFFPSFKSGQIRASWFDSPEKIKSGKKTYVLDASIVFFALPDKDS